eukprot:g1938.t1
MSTEDMEGSSDQSNGIAKAMTFAEQRALLEGEMKTVSDKESKMREQVEREGRVDAERFGGGGGDSTVQKSRHEKSPEAILHSQLQKMQKASDELIEDNFIDQYLGYFFVHPWARLFVAVGIAFLNFWILLEDPIAHSVVNANVVILGQIFGLVCTRWQDAVFGKVLCIMLGFLTGCLLGKNVIQKRILRGRCGMFRNDQGSVMIMFWSSLVCLYGFSFVFNWMFIGENVEQHLSDDMGITNEIFSKIAGTCCWVGDFLTMFLVIDGMFQNRSKYRLWARCCRKNWKGATRIIIFWVSVPIGVSLVAFIVAQDNASEGKSLWDKANILPSSELTRSFMCGIITVFDILIVVQDWDFPEFEGLIDIKFPGMNSVPIQQNSKKRAYHMAHGGEICKTPDCDWIAEAGCDFCAKPECRTPWHEITITGKWFNYGIIFMVMLFDTNMIKNQILYRPVDYGQYTNPGAYSITVVLGEDESGNRIEHVWKFEDESKLKGQIWTIFDSGSLSLWRDSKNDPTVNRLLYVGLDGDVDDAQNSNPAMNVTQESHADHDTHSHAHEHNHKDDKDKDTDTNTDPFLTSRYFMDIPIVNFTSKNMAKDKNYSHDHWHRKSHEQNIKYWRDKFCPKKRCDGKNIRKYCTLPPCPEGSQKGSFCVNATSSNMASSCTDEIAIWVMRKSFRGREDSPDLAMNSRYEYHGPHVRMLALIPLGVCIGLVMFLFSQHAKKKLAAHLITNVLAAKHSAHALADKMHHHSLIAARGAAHVYERHGDNHPHTRDKMLHDMSKNNVAHFLVAKGIASITSAELVAHRAHEKVKAGKDVVITSVERSKDSDAESVDRLTSLIAWSGEDDQNKNLNGSNQEITCKRECNKVCDKPDSSKVANFWGYIITLCILISVSALSAKILGEASMKSAPPLLVPLFFIFIFAIVIGVFVSMAEPCWTEQCEFKDVFNAVYFVVVTMTSVGYGDQVPKTWIGKTVGIACMIFGSFFLAMPLAIIGHHFEIAYEQEKQREQTEVAETRIERGQGITIIPAKQLTKRQEQAQFVCNYFELVNAQNDLDLILQSPGTERFQKAHHDQQRQQEKGKRKAGVARKGDNQNFPEMVSACWFTIVTMTTTGYGRITPSTPWSKAIAMLMMILGNFYMAMPLTIVGSTFWGHYQTMKEKEEQVRRAKHAVLTARRNSFRIKKELTEAKLKREASKKANKLNDVSDAQAGDRMLPPVQECAYHELFSMEHDIDQLLHLVQECPETEAGLVGLMLDSKVVDISKRIAVTSRMMSYMVNDHMKAAQLGKMTVLNRNAPVVGAPMVSQEPEARISGEEQESTRTADVQEDETSKKGGIDL